MSSAGVEILYQSDLIILEANCVSSLNEVKHRAELRAILRFY